jgi:protein-S-isoprenylcysteine O-methyltransferase Ste14
MSRIALTLKTVLFTVVMPGTVVGWLPWMVITSGGTPLAWYTVGERHLLGFIPLLLGLALYIAGATGFVIEGRGTPAPLDPPRALVVRGPYRWVRNPMYIAILTILLGEVMLSASARLLAYGAVVFAAFHLFITLYEEPKLASLFGDEFAEYRARVPRWIPRAPRDPHGPRAA